MMNSSESESTDTEFDDDAALSSYSCSSLSKCYSVQEHNVVASQGSYAQLALYPVYPSNSEAAANGINLIQNGAVQSISMQAIDLVRMEAIHGTDVALTPAAVQGCQLIYPKTNREIAPKLPPIVSSVALPAIETVPLPVVPRYSGTAKRPLLSSPRSNGIQSTPNAKQNTSKRKKSSQNDNSCRLSLKQGNCNKEQKHLLKNLSVALEQAKNDVLNTLRKQKEGPATSGGSKQMCLPWSPNGKYPMYCEPSTSKDQTARKRQGRMSCSPLKSSSDVLAANGRIPEEVASARKKMFFVSKGNSSDSRTNIKHDNLSDRESNRKIGATKSFSPVKKQHVQPSSDCITISDDDEDDICIINHSKTLVSKIKHRLLSSERKTSVPPQINTITSLQNDDRTTPNETPPSSNPPCLSPSPDSPALVFNKVDDEKEPTSLPNDVNEPLECDVGEPSDVVPTNKPNTKRKPDEPSARVRWSSRKKTSTSEQLQVKELLQTTIIDDLRKLPPVDECLDVIPTYSRLLVALKDAIRPDRARIRSVNAKSLLSFVRSNQLARAIAFLRKGCDPTEKIRSENGRCCLHVAAASGSLEMLLCLLYASGSHVDISDNLKTTPLMLAAAKDRLDVVKLFHRCGASLNHRDHEGKTLLHVCASNAANKVARWAVPKVDDVNAQDNGGWTALMWASDEKSGVMAQLLLSHGASPGFVDEELNHCLHWAALAGSTASCHNLIAAGSPINGINIHKETPLHIAVREGHFDIVQMLLLNGADTKTENADGKTVQETAPPGSRMESAILLKSHINITAVPQIFCSDISRGKERIAVSCINETDNEPIPDICYVTSNVETSDTHVPSSSYYFKGCDCKETCGKSVSCQCIEKTEEFTCWYNEEGALNLDLLEVERPVIFECSQYCQCWSHCTNRVVQRGVRLPLQVFRTADRGWGLRCLEDITVGTYIISYLGELLSDEEANTRIDDTYLFDLDSKDSSVVYCIDASRFGNAARFINHSCDASVSPVRVFYNHQHGGFPEMAFFATRHIEAREEICLDYGEKYWSVKMTNNLFCSCGSSTCCYSKRENNTR